MDLSALDKLAGSPTASLVLLMVGNIVQAWVLVRLFGKYEVARTKGEELLGRTLDTLATFKATSSDLLRAQGGRSGLG